MPQTGKDSPGSLHLHDHKVAGALLLSPKLKHAPAAFRTIAFRLGQDVFGDQGIAPPDARRTIGFVAKRSRGPGEVGARDWAKRAVATVASVACRSLEPGPAS